MALSVFHKGSAWVVLRSCAEAHSFLQAGLRVPGLARLSGPREDRARAPA